MSPSLAAANSLRDSFGNSPPCFSAPPASARHRSWWLLRLGGFHPQLRVRTSWHLRGPLPALPVTARSCDDRFPALAQCTSSTGSAGEVAFWSSLRWDSGLLDGRRGK